MNCPTEDTLLAVADGRFAGDSSATYEHIESCPACRVFLNELARSYGRDEDDEPRVGQSVGRYQLRRLIGLGGMGVVYAARDPELDRDVAIKLLRPDVDAQASELRARLMREAQAMARLSHPQVIAVYDIGLHGDRVYIAMELVNGLTLRHWLGDKARSWREVRSVLVLAGHGLAAAHDVGIVHRDFKPDNVMIARNGNVRVLDFGLARANPVAVMPPLGQSAIALSQTLTGGAGLVGTPLYMAPEQLAGSIADARSDQFSFCVVLYEALTGARPFKGATPHELLAAIQTGCNIAVEPKIPSWLRPIIARGLAVAPEARFASMPELLHELERDPAATRRRWMAIASVPLLIGLGAVAHQQSLQQSSPCVGAEARLVGVWDGPRRERIQSAFAATKLPFAGDAFNGMAHALDRYAQHWLAMHGEACRATRVRGEQSEELLDLRMGCLDQRRSELKALTDLFATATSSTVEHAVAAAYALSDIAACADVAALKAPMPPPRDPALRARLAKVRAHLARAAALKDFGEYESAVDVAEAALNEARDLAYAPVVAEAMLLHGDLQGRAGDNSAAEASLLEAMTAGLAAHHDRVAAEAAVDLGSTVGLWQAHRDEGRSWVAVGRALIARLGGDDRLGARAAGTRGAIALAQGKLEEALGSQKEAVALEEKSEPDSPQLAAAVHGLANVYFDLWRYDDELAADTRSLGLCEKALGPMHPEVARALTGIGLALFHLGRYDEALVQHRRALDISERTLGPAHPITAVCYVNIADVHRRRGEYDEALPFYRRGLDVWQKALGTDSPWLVSALEGIGELELKRGHPAEALVPLERSLAIRQKAGSNIAWEVAALQLSLARALWDGHGDRQRAIDMAGKARSLYVTEPRYKAELVATDAWLATHQPLRLSR